MLKHIITTLSSEGFLSSVSEGLGLFTRYIGSYFAGANNLRVVSIILILLAITLFLFLAIILYVRSMVSFLRTDKKRPTPTDIFFDSGADEEETENLAHELQLEKEMEKQLEHELEKSKQEKAKQEQQEVLRKQDEEERLRQKDKEEKEQEKQKYKTAAAIDLDWKKGQSVELSTSSIGMHSMSMQYQQSQKTINELVGLAIDMLGRGVDDLKIAQTMMYRNQGLSSEDDILQTIEAIKDFIALCVNKRFDAVANKSKLPTEEKALYHLINGDASLALALVEGLMDNSIEKSIELPAGDRRDAILRETSHHAVTFGSLANLSDIHLATGAFELAIELEPQNINAWSRLGDVYSMAENHNKAIWAYNNLLSIANEELNPRQFANANKMLSKYHYEKGDSLHAAKLYNSSKIYYDSIGINRRLDKKELEIVDIIEARKAMDIEQTIAKVLQSGALRQYSYAQ